MNVRPVESMAPLVFLVCSAFGALRGASAEELDFDGDVRPILREHCLACHGGVRQLGGLSFVYQEKVFGLTESGEPFIQPGDPARSVVFRRITADDDERMPPPDHGPGLADSEVAVLERWIRSGARWGKHWAFVPPRTSTPPEVADSGWCRVAADRFILARLESEGLSPSAAASRVEWLRRATFDLTGLPPRLVDVEAFAVDRRATAHEAVVDRLLASPHFGERWAAVWLDLARYADSQGYEKDRLRTAWPYRDWLIRALNADMPFDQFTVRQIAGDLRPDAKLDDRIATAFHRNTPTNTEGGTDDEEFRVAAVIDRVNTTWEVWQGVTFKCVQCHAHPYAPIEQPEYYRYLAFFNTSKDWDLTSDAPTLTVPADSGAFEQAREIDRLTTELRREEVAKTNTLVATTIWQPLEPVEVVSTGQTQLVLKEADGFTEVHTRGTVSHNSRFTLAFEIPEAVTRLTALRVDVLPRRPAKARHTPELGFVISELQAELFDPDDLTGAETADDIPPQAQAVEFVYALGDEVDPFGEAQATLEEDRAGWGAKPRLTHPRRLILVAREPVTIQAGERLRLTIRQEDAPNDMMPLVMNRGRYSITADDNWSRFAGDPTFVGRREEITRLVEERVALGGAALPVMAEQDVALRRTTAVFRRGSWLDKEQSVQPGVPEIFGGLAGEGVATRLDLARWMVSPKNPLTARVAVNRFWQQLFGTGLVETLEDFGPSGQPPSHPELLDFLALRFSDKLQWSVKRLLRELVLSSTYRQEARVSSTLRQRDPRNRLLARGPRRRLTAEMVRANALSVAGLLTPKLHGPSVMPPQPDIGRAARSSVEWKISAGADRYRRALYTLWRRSNVYPSMVTFDAPNRLVCTARRITTNTPLQALVTLNDPVYMECAVALAGQMRRQGNEPAAQIARGHLLATGNPPRAGDLQDLLTLYSRALEVYDNDETLARKVAATKEEAALALVANAILNLDAVLTR